MVLSAIAVCLTCCRRVAEDSVKNYQLWNHRRKIALAMGPAAAEAELQFCAGESTHGSQAGQALQQCQCLWWPCGQQYTARFVELRCYDRLQLSVSTPQGSHRAGQN